MTTHEVFKLTELLELIFANQDDDTLRSYRTVSRKWRDVATQILQHRGKRTAVSTRWATSSAERLKFSGMWRKCPPESIIRYACMQGSIQAAQWVTERFAFAAKRVRHLERECLKRGPHGRERAPKSPMMQACESGALEVVRWLQERCDVKFNGAYVISACKSGKSLPILQLLCAQGNVDGATLHGMEILPRLCYAGDLPAAQWVTDTVHEAAKYASDAEDQASTSLEQACYGGHTEVADWLISKYKMGPQHATFGYSHILCTASYNSNSNMAKFIMDRLQVVNVPEEHQVEALGIAARHSDVEMVRWLTERFGLTVQHVRWDGNELLRRACEAANLDTIKWIADHFQLTAEDARANGNEVLHGTCENRTPIGLRTAQWLADRFNLTSADLLSDAGETLLKACRGELSRELMQWMVERFDLTVEDIYTPKYGSTSAYDLCTDGGLKRWLDDRYRAASE